MPATAVTRGAMGSYAGGLCIMALPRPGGRAARHPPPIVNSPGVEVHRVTMRPLVLILFFFSGASALLYQVVWARLLTHVFGTTATAIGVVLAAFMTGLALGAWLLGRMADGNLRPLRFYAALEIGIAATALAAHFALTNMTPVYLALYEWSGESPAILAVTRFVLAFALVTIPTSLMGGTLPVLARFL